MSKDYFCKDTEVYKGLLDLMKEKGWNPELPVDTEGNTALAFPAAIPATGWVKRHSVGCSRERPTPTPPIFPAKLP